MEEHPDSPALWTATSLAEAIRDRRVSSRELLDEHLGRLDKINPGINAVVTVDAERAYAAAGEADQATARGESWGPLHGLPFTVKDAIETAGIRTTGGARELAHHVPEHDAPAVKRLRDAGAILYGKTNAPRWSSDIQTYNDLFGTTNNPWDPARTPGGSSGGSAAAVATGLTAFELGTDIGGSIRIPSGFCGVFGHKPSFGLVPQTGYLDHVGGGTIDVDVNVVGPLARSTGDLGLLLDVLAGPSGEAAKAWTASLPPARHEELSAFRIGLWLDDPATDVATEVADVLSSAADALSGAGAKVSEDHPQIQLAEAQALFRSLVTAAMSVVVEPTAGDLVGGSHRTWLDNHRARQRMRGAWAEWFRDFDLLLCPVTPVTAFLHDHRGTLPQRSFIVNGRPYSHMEATTWTGLVGVVYLPSTVVPVGFTEQGLPVGIQVVAPYLEDRNSLLVGGALAALTGGFTPPPVARTS